MTELLSSAQMRAIEQAAMDSGAVTGLELMERAGQGVVEAIISEWPQLQKGHRRAVVLCGPGNNGGDGFVVARLLKAAGWGVDVFLYGDAAKLPPDAKVNHDLLAADHTVLDLTTEAVFAAQRPDVIVDAVFGIGLTRPLPRRVADVLNRGLTDNWAQPDAIRTVAVDCPSGLNLDTGFVPQDSEAEPERASENMADLTVTFHSPKPGHYLAMGPRLCRKLVTVDIGLRGDAQERAMLGQPPHPGPGPTGDPCL